MSCPDTPYKSGSVTIFGLEQKPASKNGGLLFFEWSAKYEPPDYLSTMAQSGFSPGAGSVTQIFEFLWEDKRGVGFNARASFNMANGNFIKRGRV